MLAGVRTSELKHTVKLRPDVGISIAPHALFAALLIHDRHLAQIVKELADSPRKETALGDVSLSRCRSDKGRKASHVGQPCHRHHIRGTW